MRGKGEDSSGSYFGTGITPAYAGKSLCCTRLFQVLLDHPRLCGEKVNDIVYQLVVIGSPPPMRGKAIENPVPMKIFKDHPRLCGEKFQQRATLPALKGSPPPMRGKEAVMEWTSVYGRITPAYAGKSFGLDIAAAAVRDHPRLCGEK